MYDRRYREINVRYALTKITRINGIREANYRLTYDRPFFGSNYVFVYKNSRVTCVLSAQTTSMSRENQLRSQMVQEVQATDDILEKLTAECLSRGYSGILALGRWVVCCVMLLASVVCVVVGVMCVAGVW